MNNRPTFEDIQSAYLLVSPHLHRTPVLQSSSLNLQVGASLYFKCENFQKGGAYKARGACYNILSLNADERQKGVCTQSSGNHGSCLSKMGQQFGVPVYVVMPSNSPSVKIEATKAYNGTIIISGITQKEREEKLEEVKEQHQAIYIPPYDSWRTITGAGTVALEFLDQQQDLDLILTPLGGGGLCSGTIIVAKWKNIPVIGVEPELASDGLASLKSGVIQDQMPVRTICDGLRTKLGSKTFEIIKENIKDIWVVSEEEIIQATILIWQRLKIFVETSSAVVLAAAIKHKEEIRNKKVGLILSGGNVDLNVLKQYL